MEITKQLHLTDSERNLVEMHSALNILNILTYELLNLSEHIGGEEALMPAMTKVQEIASTLSDKDKTLRHLAQIGVKDEEILEIIKTAMDLNEADASKGKTSESYGKAVKIVDNIRSILNVLELRSTEIIARERRSASWVRHATEDLKERFRGFFSALEQNSNNRFTIVHDRTLHNENSYLILYSIEGKDEGSICMPPEIQDVMRDLLANARKYTDPGGKIDARLYEEGEQLRLRVEDTGKGIPEDQLDTIVEYGHRASNVEEKPSYGGGFGLTKAYYICRKYDGRMWIDSELERGTVVRIEIPIPPEACKK